MKYIAAPALILFLIGVASPRISAQFKLEPYVSGLSQPVEMVQDPTRPDVQYVVQKEGLIRVIQAGNLQSSNLIDLTGSLNQNGEKFLFSLAFAPDYASSGKAYVCYVDNDVHERIEQFTRSASNPLELDPASGVPVIVMPTSYDHWGGTIRFGPDGFLYVALGDGDQEYDPNNNSQDPNSLHGKMLRIDPSRDDFPNDPNRNYGIPADNPFLDGSPISALPEIWSFGFRNPWKWSFDMPSAGGNGAMIIGDVGQDNWEEVDYEAPGEGGRNYGWRQREGFHDSGLGGTSAYRPLTDPVFEYGHLPGVGASVTGGFVYHGDALPAFFKGRYFFGDFVNGQLWSMGFDSGRPFEPVEHTLELGAGAAGLVTSIDVDSNGELYLVDFRGSIRKLVMQPTFAPTSFRVIHGTTLSGDLADLESSDDRRLVIATPFRLVSSAAPLDVEFDGVIPTQPVSGLTFTIESQGKGIGMGQVIQLFDHAARRWIVVDSRPATNRRDGRVTVTIREPARFINPSSGQVKARLVFYATPMLSSVLAAVQIDQAVWSYTP